MTLQQSALLGEPQQGTRSSVSPLRFRSWPRGEAGMEEGSGLSEGRAADRGESEQAAPQSARAHPLSLLAFNSTDIH